MKRHAFTKRVARLIMWIDGSGWYPLLDYALRSTEEQQRLFEEGKSRCDGVNEISAHQYPDAGGRYAVDIYMHDGDFDIAKKRLYEQAHQFWEAMGGKPMLSWDIAHFEVE